MDGSLITAPFYRMGARARVVDSDLASRLRLNILRDRHGEFFDITAPTGTDLRVVDLRVRERHLLLVGSGEGGVKNKYLCGHDEREWFVAGIPNDRGVSDVRTAIEALKPDSVRFEQDRLGVPRKHRARRRNAAYVRQGEWFFLPRPEMSFEGWLLMRNEPLSRGLGSKPHIAQLAHRSGGELVYTSSTYPRGIIEAQYKNLLKHEPEQAKRIWRTMRRNPDVYVRGRVSHPDHATVTLPCWHLVQMNTESRAPAMRHVAFLD
jgi:hypothetical protein